MVVTVPSAATVTTLCPDGRPSETTIRWVVAGVVAVVLGAAGPAGAVLAAVGAVGAVGLVGVGAGVAEQASATLDDSATRSQRDVDVARTIVRFARRRAIRRRPTCGRGR